MKVARAQSRCECQSILLADVREDGVVVSGHVRPPGGELQKAPANVTRSQGDQLDIGWLCPYCGRNTLRTFYRGALHFSDVA